MRKGMEKEKMECIICVVCLTAQVAVVIFSKSNILVELGRELTVHLF